MVVVAITSIVLWSSAKTKLVDDGMSAMVWNRQRFPGS